MKNIFYLLILITVCDVGQSVRAQNKQPLNHSVYNDWKTIANKTISNNGWFIAYELQPGLGNSWLYVYDTRTGKTDSIYRATSPRFSAASNALMYTLKPPYDSLRQAKLEKVKKEDLPKDSIGIFKLYKQETLTFGPYKSVAISEEPSDWIAIMLEYGKKAEQKNKEKTASEKSKKTKDKKGGRLLLLNLRDGDTLSFEHVSQYALSKNGESLGMIQVFGDSIDSLKVSTFNTSNRRKYVWLNQSGYAENISIAVDGKQLAFTYSSDTIKNKTFGLYYAHTTTGKLSLVSGDGLNRLPDGWSVSQFGEIYFKDDGSELYFGTAPKPIPEVKDTLTDEEKVSLDIWNWKDPLLQTEQLIQLEKEKKRSYQSVYFTEEDTVIQLANEQMEEVRLDKKAVGYLTLAYTGTPYQMQSSWDGSAFRDYYLLNRRSGDRRKVLEAAAATVSMSPNQHFVGWYNIMDSSWNAYDIQAGVSRVLTASITHHFYNELNDIPDEADPYGMAGWTKDEKLVVYDQFDLWLIDPKNEDPHFSLTNGEGRKKQIRYRYVRLDPEESHLPDTLLLSAFNILNKQSGFSRLVWNTHPKLENLVMDDYWYARPLKAKDANRLCWTRESFRVFPDCYTSDATFNYSIKISHANPQQANYRWGDVELVHWVTDGGDSMQGLLYKPEGYDALKSYPMLVYFYERYSDLLHRHYIPKPIRSVINFSYYASNDYFIFIPDIKYSEGKPGPSSLDFVLSGTKSVLKKYPCIDEERLGIQGQSWGGYQTAFIITKTNMFRAAMAGAPVSNMTSAYGGIRWESGKSRAFQYEETQSRIGATLWEAFPAYVENSPVFFADQIETPLLMMHNDKDGAVPWTQGIELFTALRRLHKPAWLLVYNGAPHNLKRWADMQDLTVRMQQFFDHFLKDAPEPRWMKEGIPAIHKGTDYGF